MRNVGAVLANKLRISKVTLLQNQAIQTLILGYFA